MLPARSARPWLWVGAASAVVVVAGIALFNGRRSAAPRPAATASIEAARVPNGGSAPGAVEAAGRIRAVVQNADSARFFIDGRLVASGGREADVGSVAADRPHVLRVEADGWTPSERPFNVAAGGVVEMQVALTRHPAEPPAAIAGSAPSPPEHPVAPHASAPRPHASAPRSPSAPPPTGKAPRHRDGLVGDDIFDSPKK